MIGDPLLIAVCAMIGLQRRSYRVQAEQSAALLAQHERLRAEQRRADVLDERARIAREIHDVLAHSLGALGIQIQAAKAMLTDHGDVDRAVEALTTAQRMAADGLTETRRAVHALRVDTLPLGQELAAVADTTGSAITSRSPSISPAWPGRCRQTPRSRCCAPHRRRWSTPPSTRRASRSRSASTTAKTTCGSASLTAWTEPVFRPGTDPALRPGIRAALQPGTRAAPAATG